MDALRSNRGYWLPPSDFFFSCLSLTLTSSDITRTPFMLKENGGGVSFLVKYLAGLVTVIFPLMFMEISLGQFASGGMLSIWNCCPLFKGVGYAAMVMLGILCMYSAVAIGWPLHYLLVTIISKDNIYPWTSCDNAWNTASCFDVSGNTIPLGGIGVNTTNIAFRISPEDEYYNRRFIQMSDGILETGSVNWELLIALITVWTLSFLSLTFGHYSLGKVAFFTSLGPFGLVLALTVRACTLPGASKGIEYMFKPDLGLKALRMFQYHQVLQSYGGLLLQYSPLFGVYAMLGSYNKKNYNFYRDIILVVVISVLFPIICTVMIGGFVGFLSQVKGREMKNILNAGDGLLYNMMPEILSIIPKSKLWLSLFYVAIFLLSFGNQIMYLEAIVTGIADEFFPKHLGRNARMIFRTIGAFILCLVLFLPGIGLITQAGLYWYTIFAQYTLPWTLPVLFIFGCIGCTWIYGINNYAYDVKTMLGCKPNYIILGGLIGVAPLAGVGILCGQVLLYYPSVTMGNYVFPPFCLIVGWCIAGLSLIMIPLLIIIHCSRSCCCPMAEQRSIGICRRFFDAAPNWKKQKIQTTYQPLAQITADQLQSSKKAHLYPSVDETQT